MPGAIRPHVLLLECGEWLASVQTDKLDKLTPSTCSSLLLLLHRLAEQGVARQSSGIVIVVMLMSFCCSCLFFSLVMCFVVCFSVLVEVF